MLIFSLSVFVIGILIPWGRGYEDDAQTKQLVSYKFVFISYFCTFFTTQRACTGFWDMFSCPWDMFS